MKNLKSVLRQGNGIPGEVLIYPARVASKGIFFCFVLRRYPRGKNWQDLLANFKPVFWWNMTFWSTRTGLARIDVGYCRRFQFTEISNQKDTIVFSSCLHKKVWESRIPAPRFRGPWLAKISIASVWGFSLGLCRGPSREIRYHTPMNMSKVQCTINIINK